MKVEISEVKWAKEQSIHIAMVDKFTLNIVNGVLDDANKYAVEFINQLELIKQREEPNNKVLDYTVTVIG